MTRTPSITNLVVSMVLATTPTAAAQVFATEDEGRVLDESMVETHGHPVTMDNTNILLFDQPGGVPRVVPVHKGLTLVVGAASYREQGSLNRRLARRSGDLDPIESPYLTTTNGQRIPGAIATGADGRVSWRNTWLPNLELDPETISEIRFIERAEVPTPSDADMVVLANGDRIEGLVESIGSVVSLEIVGGERDGDSVEIPIDRVAAVALVNPPVEPKGTMVWYRGGHRILGETLQIDDDGYTRVVRPDLGGDIAEVPTDYLMAASFDAGRIRPWASLDWRQSEGAVPGVRPWIPPIEQDPGHHPLDASPLRVRGAMRATAETPWRRAAFRVLVERAPDSGPGVCFFVVRDGDREIARRRIDPETPLAVISGVVEGGRLVFEVEQGPDGPFEDDLVLREALIMRSGD